MLEVLKANKTTQFVNLRTSLCQILIDLSVIAVIVYRITISADMHGFDYILPNSNEGRCLAEEQ